MSPDDFTEHQLAKLASSGLTPEFVLAQGARPVQADETLGPEWQGSGAASPPGIMWTWTSPDGDAVEQWNPDTPLLNKSGDPIKYAFRKGVGSVINVLRPVTDDTKTVLIVEGTKQGLAMLRYAPIDCAIYGIAGCWGFSQDKMPADLSFAEDKPVVVFVDADAGTNPSVYAAMSRLKTALDNDGAESVKFAQLGTGGTTGIDDLIGKKPEDKRAGFIERLIKRADKKIAETKPTEKTHKAEKAATEKSGGDRDRSALLHVDGEDRPYLVITGDPLIVIDTLTGELIRQHDAKTLFSRGGLLSRYVRPRDEREMARMELVTKPVFYGIIQETARMGMWSEDENGDRVFVDAWPHSHVIEATLARHDTFSPLDGLSRTPFVREDGTVCQQPGYDQPSRVLLVPDAAMTELTVPDEPTAEDAAMAATFVLKEWLGDMPFHEDADRANALALALTPVIRDLVPLAPVAVVNGLQMGVGKNLLGDCLAIAATGRAATPLPYTRDDAEQRKVITSGFQRGDSMFVFDEAHVIEGASFARAVTSLTYTDRTLGSNTMPEYPNRVTWMTLGNQVQVRGDMTRRVYPIHLHTKAPYPQDRDSSQFRHPDLKTWTLEHRGEIVSALLTMVRAWYVAGQPKAGRGASFGSFERWDELVGGVIAYAGVPAFLGNMREFRSESDYTTAYWTEHLVWLAGQFGDETFTVGQVVAKLGNRQSEPALPPGDKLSDPTEKGYARNLGEAYSTIKNRWFGEVKIVREGLGHRSVAKWRVQTIDVPGDPAETTDPDPTPMDDRRDGGTGGTTTPSRTRKSVSSTDVEGHGYISTEGRGVGHPASPSVPPAGAHVVLDIETGDAKDLTARYGTRPYFRVGGLTAAGDYRHTTDVRELGRIVAESASVVGHNAIAFDLPVIEREAPGSFDLLRLAREGRVIDTMVLDALRNPPEPGMKPERAMKEYSLAASSARHGVEGKTDDLKALAKKHGGFGAIPTDDPEYLAYLEGDVQASRELVRAMLKEQPLSEYERREMRVAAIASQMTATGFRVDQDLAQYRFWQGFGRRRTMARKLRDVYGLPLAKPNGEESDAPQATKAGREVVERVLVEMGVDITQMPKTDTGALSLGKVGMDWVAETYPDHVELVELAETLKDIAGVRSVYGTAIQYTAPDGRVHPDVTTLQASGRWSVTNPGMTVFGKREGKVIERAIFVPDEGNVLIAADLSQVDARAVAAHSQDHAYMALFEPGKDSHEIIARRVWGDRAYDADPKTYRHRAKAIGHGWNYGMGIGKLAFSAGVSEDEAEKFDAAMREQFPRLVEWKREVVTEAKTGNLLDNGFGRLMRPNPDRAYTQGPALMGQGTARDLMMQCLLNLPDDIARMLRVQVHDEIVLEVPRADEAEVRAELHKAMHFEWAPAGADRPIQITADAGPSGASWADCY